MIAAGVATIPSSNGSITINPGFTAKTFFLVCGSATADGFATVPGGGARGSACLGIVSFDTDGTTLRQTVMANTYLPGAGGPLGGVCRQDCCVDIYYGSGVHSTVGVATSLNAGGLTISFNPTIAGRKLYWVAIDDLSALVGSGGSPFDTTVTLGVPASAFIGQWHQQPTTSVNGLATVAFGGRNPGPGGQGSEYGGLTEAWAAAQDERFWNAVTGAGNLVQEVENLNFAGGVSLLGGWVREPATSRIATGVRLDQHLLDLDTVGALWAIAEPTNGRYLGIIGSAATVDSTIGFKPSVIITLGAQSVATWATCFGLSVPSLGFDVSAGASTDGTSVVEFRDPARSWMSGWNHATAGATKNGGTLEALGTTQLRAVRTASGAVSTGFGALVLGQPAPLLHLPKIWRYV